MCDAGIEWLRRHGNFEGITLTAIPEGRVVHPNVPLTVVSEPVLIVTAPSSPVASSVTF